ncbi:hypothetical protein AKJ16_DCAP16390 [Drosera capensis]
MSSFIDSFTCKGKRGKKVTGTTAAGLTGHTPSPNGSARIVEEDDRDPIGDDGGQTAPRIPRPVRASSHPAQQVPSIRVLLAMEVRERAPFLREVPVRARHGADAPDAEDQGRREDEGKVRGGGAGARVSWLGETRPRMRCCPFLFLFHHVGYCFHTSGFQDSVAMLPSYCFATCHRE